MMTWTLDDAERLFDDMMRDPSLTYERRLSLARAFFRRAYMHPEDAEKALRSWAESCPLTASPSECLHG